MVERLTDKHTVSVYNNSNSEIYLGGNEEATKYIYKLAQLEDIMEKYGIESFELLEHIIKKGIVINSIIEDFAKEEYDKMKQDRNTWKKACELACEWFKQTGFIGDQTEVDYFYQQAKKEGNDE